MPYNEYSRLTPEQRSELVRERLARGYPPHSPPHPVRDQPFYLITSTCYKHARHMRHEARRRQVLDGLFQLLTMAGIELRAWVVLPNHYHLLLHIPEFSSLGSAIRLVHGPTSREWNLEDGAPGRRVWYRYADRAMRSDRHYYTTLNYIHYNPVKHGWAESPYKWLESSVHWYLECFGRQWLRDLWAAYPLRSFGSDWDDIPGPDAVG